MKLGKKFQCPRCDSRHFGMNVSDETHNCHDEFGCNCRWRGMESDCAVDEWKDSTVLQLHAKAMESLERGEKPLAMAFEHRAAIKADAQPTRSVLFRSAATIALECGWHWRAKQLAKEGLKDAPYEIAEELTEVLEEAEAKFSKLDERRE